MGSSKTTSDPSSERFVVHEHHARALHWDFRLARDGVLVSWALPRGVPLDPKRNHLAVATEDHPLEYADFSGQIPQGEYGAGAVHIWDSGTYEIEKWSEREVMVVLHGQRLEGRYVLFKTNDKNWMIHRMDPAPSGWEPLPGSVRPMLCQAGPLPSSSRGWRCEFKWDGARAIVYVEGGRITLKSRNDLDISIAYPELHSLGRAFGSRSAVLDGEIVAFDPTGRPSFERLQKRMHVRDARTARRLAERLPVSFLAFDLLHLDDRSTIGLPYLERRALLESLSLAAERWTTPPAFKQRPAVVMEAAMQAGLEGVVCKRVDSIYVPGRRSEDWIKVRAFQSQEVVVAGYTPGKGSRAGSLGALVVGIPKEGGLVYAGKVGSGFSDVQLSELQQRLFGIRADECPFASMPPRAQIVGVTWVQPFLVGEVRFNGWTRQGRLRQSTWRGLRPDKSPEEVVVES